MSKEMLTRMADGEQLEKIKVELGDEGFEFEIS